MRKSLESLLRIPKGHLDGVIKDVDCCIEAPNRTDLQFHYIQLQDGDTRVTDFVEVLESGIVYYCLNREDATDTNPLNATRRVREAREMFVRGGHSGEAGELALYMFLESKLNAPQILSKMDLKTSGNMNFHGSDSVHMGIDSRGNILLFIGESKVYQSLSASINACLSSVANYYFDELVDYRTQYNFDIRLISSNLDIEDLALKRKVKNLLDPWSGNKERLRIINACFLIFEWDYLNELSILDDDADKIEAKLIDEYKSEMARIGDLIKKHITAKNLKKLRFHFFLIPVPNAQDFYKKFSKAIGL